MRRLDLLSETEDKLGYALNLTTAKITDHQAAGPEQQSEQPAIESNPMSDTAVGGDEPSAFKSQLEESNAAATKNTEVISDRTFESQQLASRADTSCHGEQIWAEEVHPVLKAHLRSATVAVTAADSVPTEQPNDSVFKLNQPSRRHQQRDMPQMQNTVPLKHAQQREQPRNRSLLKLPANNGQPRLKVNRGSSEGR